MKKIVLGSILFSPMVRSAVVDAGLETSTTVIADFTSQAINKLAALRRPASWAAESLTVRTSYDKETGFLEVSLTR